MRDRAQLASGIVVALCLATFRYGDRCTTAVEVLRGPERPVRSSGPPPSLVDDADPITSIDASTPWSHVLQEVAPASDLELTRLPLDGLSASPATINFVHFGKVHCPNLLDISEDPAGWNALKEGAGINCAPIVVLGRLGENPWSIRHTGHDIPISWFAGECLLLGARCTFVACDSGACIADTHDSFGDILEGPLAPYLGVFLERIVHQPAPPALIAQPGAVDGKPVVTLASPRPAGPP